MNESLLEAATRIWHSLGVVAVSGARIVGILLAAWLALGVARRTLRALRERIALRLEDAEAIKRADTLSRVFRYITTVVISLITFIAVLSELGVSVAPILGAAGVVGLAVGFGAQSLVKDYVTGLFLLIENQIRQGDVVQLGEHSGSVEEVTLRYVRLRDYSGNVYYIPNGTITTVINMSRGFAHAVVDIGVAYRADLELVMQIMRDVAARLRRDAVYADRILDDIEIAGVQDWTDSAVKIRARIRVVALSQWDVRRVYLLRLKQAFDAHGIEIPFPQLTLHRQRIEQRPEPPTASNGVAAREGDKPAEPG
jgi:small conductance mechanosensitive channel